MAASAPVLQFTGLTKCQTYNDIVSRVFADSGHNCAECIKKSWPIIRQYASNGNFLTYTRKSAFKLTKTHILNFFKEETRSKLNKILRLCPKSLITDFQNASTLIGWISDVFGNTAMINYPYETNFLNPVPAWPVKVSIFVYSVSYSLLISR